MSGREALTTAVELELGRLGVGEVRCASIARRLEQYLTNQGYYIAPITPAETVGAHRTDPRTSHTAAKYMKVKAGTQRFRLLAAFAAAFEGKLGVTAFDGLTDEEAMEVAEGVSPKSEYATRCSELRTAGYIVDTGQDRKGDSRLPRIICRITPMGLAAYRREAGL